MREVAWVVYDEVHYLRDKERGVVWEESIILLPHSVKYVFLSATIPNSKQFCEWIASLHHQPCHAVYTDHRPTPLMHYVFPLGGNGLYLIKNEKGQWMEQNIDLCWSQLNLESASSSTSLTDSRTKRKSQQAAQQSSILDVVRCMSEKGLDPLIVFSFAKKECEAYAIQVARLDFNDQDEKQLIEQIFTRAISSLSDEDQQLPQVHSMLTMLKRGVGIHHGGLLPIVKEIVEILFQEGFIKVLFATETFSIGINFPAKSVVFSSCRKWDGTEFRQVRSGEYIQMSGRAGRRGIDKKGVVVQVVDERVEKADVKEMVHGPPDTLYSSYKVKFGMLLNMMRVNDCDPTKILKSTFRQFQRECELPYLEVELQSLQETLSSLPQIPDSVREYVNLVKEKERLEEEMRYFISLPQYSTPFIQPGRLILVDVEGMTREEVASTNKEQDEEEEEGEDDQKKKTVKYQWGMVIRLKQMKSGDSISFQQMSGASKVSSPHSSHHIHILLPKLSTISLTEEDLESKNLEIEDDPNDESLCGERKEVGLWKLCGISSLKLKANKFDLRKRKDLQILTKTVLKAQQLHGGSLPLVDPIDDMKIDNETGLQLIEKVNETGGRIVGHEIHSMDNKDEMIRLLKERQEITEKIQFIQQEISSSKSVVDSGELRGMKRCLRRLGFFLSLHLCILFYLNIIIGL